MKANQLSPQEFALLQSIAQEDKLYSQLAPTNYWEILRCRLTSGIGVAYGNSRNPSIKVTGSLLDLWFIYQVWIKREIKQNEKKERKSL